MVLIGYDMPLLARSMRMAAMVCTRDSGLDLAISTIAHSKRRMPQADLLRFGMFASELDWLQEGVVPAGQRLEDASRAWLGGITCADSTSGASRGMLCVCLCSNGVASETGAGHASAGQFLPRA